MHWKRTSGLLAYEPFTRAGVVAAVTTRGESEEAGNFSFTVTQNPEAVCANRRAACEALGFTVADLIVPQQTHGANVKVVGSEDRGRGALNAEEAIPDCDALITNTPGVLLGITVADCLPVFLLDLERRALGLAHSGWRGTAGRIVPRALTAMMGISAEGYEVDDRVRTHFDPDATEAPGVFTPSRPGHWRLDLAAAVSHQLHSLGVSPENIALCPYHTDRHSDLLYSHRAVPYCPRMAAFFGLPCSVMTRP
jgi:YfiH family protein